MSTNEPMTKERLHAIQGWVDRATKGRWHIEQEYDDEGSPYGLFSVREENGLLRQIPVAEGIDRLRDAEFIVHAREGIPALLAEVERLHDELAKAREVTEEKVEVACKAFYEEGADKFDDLIRPQWDNLVRVSPGVAQRYREGVSAALGAMLGGEQE